MGKGSRARPLSVSQEEFSNSFEKIFGKKDKDMQVRANPEGSIGTCGCGRSPTGDCCGWHGLTEDQYKIRKSEWDLEQYKKQAQEIWNDSCTSGRAE
jgi:hypothetical protein